MASKMALHFLLLSAISLGPVIGDSTTTSDLLWPKPSQATFGSEVYEVDSATFAFTTDGAGAGSIILKSAMDRYYVLIFEAAAPFYPTGGSTQPKGPLPGLKVTVNSADESLNLTTDESCKLLLLVV